jgi:hypothetical protein
VPNGICTCRISEEIQDIFWQCQRFTKERKDLTKGLLKRWNTLLLDPSDVYALGAVISGIKIKM